MIKVLHIVPNMHAAGLETFIMNIYRNIDRSCMTFDFLTHYKGEYFYDEEIKKLGGEIFKLSFRDDKNIFKYLKDLNLFFKHHRYDIVHCHMPSTSIFTLYYAKKYGVKVRILHSHNTSTEYNLKGYLKHLMLKFSLNFANEFFACGRDAGNFLFEKRNYKIIHNAVDLDKFLPNKETRNSVRKLLGVENKLVLGHIGRFNSQKNHAFLIDLADNLRKRNCNFCLILIGEGELEDKIKSLVSDKKLDNFVKFLGVRSDINNLYQAMDIFLLPSLFEGLPVVGIESQVSGLISIISDKVTNEVKISDYVNFLPLDINIWADFILNISGKSHPTFSYFEEKKKIEKAGYNIVEEAKRLQNEYISLVNTHN